MSLLPARPCKVTAWPCFAPAIFAVPIYVHAHGERPFPTVDVTITKVSKPFLTIRRQKEKTGKN